LVSLVDLYPTLMDLTGAPCAADLDGQSFAPELVGRPCTRRPWVLAEYHDSTCNTGWFMLREDRWKYIAYAGHPPQIFDLASDPAEVHNLAETRPDICRQLDARLRRIVDYAAVDARVKAYDRASFARWRQERLAAGDYRALMSRIFSGWDKLAADECQAWTDADEARILAWLS
jgi:choline-sulfatase